MKVDLEKAIKVFAECGLELLETEYISRNTKMKYRCPKHHNIIQYRSYQTQVGGKKGCLKCSKESAIRKTRQPFSEVVDVLEKQGLKLLEIAYLGKNQKVHFRCNKHPENVQIRPLDSIKQGLGCRKCVFLKKSEKLSGKNSANWKGGITTFNDSLRNTVIGWRKSIFEKFDNKCCISGVTENLVVHHVTPFHVIRDSVLNELGYDSYFRIKEWTCEDFSEDEISLIKLKIREYHENVVGFLITDELHKEFHKEYGMRATLEDFLEFKEKKVKGNE